VDTGIVVVAMFVVDAAVTHGVEAGMPANVATDV
jgi:hypothetical protein